MKYIDAGYVVALGSLALYAGWLVTRRRRLEAAVARRRASEAGPPAPPGGDR